MNNQPARLPENIRQKFPHLQPLKGVPSLTTMNGFGLGMYGRRDFDQETQTYIKTRCLCALFIPLFALDAYRVADAGRRTWFFFAKEPLSGFARSWNTALGCALVLIGLAVGWNMHTSSPEYRARQDVRRAAALMKEGQPLKAAGLYRRQVNGPAATDARKGFKDAVEACLQSGQPETSAGAFRLLAALPGRVNRPAPLVPDAFHRALALVEKFRTAQPEGALDILNAAAPLAPTNSTAPSLRIDLLKRIVAARPDNTNRVVELAVAYEKANELQQSWKLLRPYAHRLGDTEGARILGQRLLEEGNYQEAYALLFPYVQTRLGSLHAAEASYSNAVASVSRQAIRDLNAGRGDRSFYDSYRNASKTQQEALVDKYVESRIRSDAVVGRALERFKQANRIVPVALDLGIVQLNRAQELKDPPARKAELEAAEKTFLAVRTSAGETDQYRLFLGQVYYWLGRSREGKALFDQLLARHKRSFPILMALGNTLRSVGETADARALAEEAYRTARSSKNRYNAAALRALLFKDNDDQIAWLEKSDPEASWIQIELNSARGKKALRQGNKTVAANFLRQAIRGYENQPKSSASLNNCGLCYFDLYEATGNSDDHRRGMSLLEEAIAMNPSDSILLQNTMYFLITRAVMDVVHDSIHTDRLGEQAHLGMLANLYSNGEERSRVYQKLRQDEAMKKGLAYLDKALLLAPKSIGLYASAVSMYGGFHDLNALEKLEQRFRIAAPDTSELRQDTLQAYSGSKDKENLERCQTRIRTLEGLAHSPAVVDDPGLTSEYVSVSLVELLQNAWICGGKLDGRNLLQTALAAYRKHKSSATRQALASAYFFMASQDLARQNAEYGAWVERTRRAVPPEYLLAFVLERGGPMADLARKDDNLAQALALEKQTIASFPSWASITQWALFRTLDPDMAAQVGRRFKENRTARLIDELQFQINPASATAVLEQYWTQKLLGDEARAENIYRQALRAGVPLPPI